jgi:phospholipase/carboxylesterase
VTAALRAAVLALVLAGAAGCGGVDREETGTTTSAPAATTTKSCNPGVHALTLRNGQAALMRVTPGGPKRRALVLVLHGAGQTPEDGLGALRGGWSTPGLVLIAPAAKGQTWSVLTSDEDRDAESLNLALRHAYEHCDIDRTRIAVAGFSDGATYALTLGVSNGELFPAVIALSPGGIVGRGQVGAPRIFVAHGTLDDVLPIARAGDAVVRQLREAGYSVTYRRFRGGHEASTATSAAAIRWFLAG